MKFYALVIWRLRGVVPAMLQLIYLGNGEILRYEPDEDDLRATERKVEAVWAAIRAPRRPVTGSRARRGCATGAATSRSARRRAARSRRCPERVPVPDPVRDLDTDEGVTAQP